MSTDAKRKANKKHEEDKTGNIRFRVPKGKREKIRQCAEENGESVNAMLNRLVDKEIAKHTKKEGQK